MRAIIKYPGSKWRTAAWIISHFPPHHSYLEPFFGSGGVLFNKPRSNIETVNDLDREVVNLFGWIQRDPERLARVLYWTPYAREVYDRAFWDMHTETDSFKRAVNFYIRMMFGRGFRTTGEKGGVEERRARPGSGIRRHVLGKDPGKRHGGSGAAAGRPDRALPIRGGHPAV